MAPGLGQLKPDTTGSSHRGRPASDFSTFPFISNIIYIPSLGVKVQSDAHYSSTKIISLTPTCTHPITTSYDPACMNANSHERGHVLDME